MIRVVLPQTNRRAMARAFAITFSLAGASLISCVWAWAGLAYPGITWICAAVLLPAGIFGTENGAWYLYDAWNRFLANPLAALGRRWIMAVCYFVVFPVTGMAGSRFHTWVADPGTLWIPRISLDRNAYHSVFGMFQRPSIDKAWTRTYLIWARSSGNGWAIVLLPFLVLLRLCAAEEEKAVQSNIYTLF